MAKVLIASFSQTGSTKKIADLISKGLHSSDWEITHFNISGNYIHPVDVKITEEKQKIIPSNFPLSSGITKPTALAAPVVVGIIETAADLALLKSLWGRSKIL